MLSCVHYCLPQCFSFYLLCFLEMSTLWYPCPFFLHPNTLMPLFSLLLLPTLLHSIFLACGMERGVVCWAGAARVQTWLDRLVHSCCVAWTLSQLVCLDIIISLLFPHYREAFRHFSTFCYSVGLFMSDIKLSAVLWSSLSNLPETS